MNLCKKKTIYNYFNRYTETHNIIDGNEKKQNIVKAV